MFNNIYIKEFTDIMTDGFIYIDNTKRIRVYNKKAKELFGLTIGDGKGHPLGVLSQGDIVIIADTNIGKDDGRLEADDLRKIGIEEADIQDGDSFLAIGKYMDADKEPILKTSRSNNSLSIEGAEKGIKLSAKIDTNNKDINISVGDKDFPLSYFDSIGHLVILDKDTMDIKFYQSKGYTARKESIKDILNGAQYLAKKLGDEIDVIGKHLFEIHEETTDFISFINNSMEVCTYNEKFMYINGHPVLCYVKPLIIDDKIDGLQLRLKDITQLTALIEERNSAIEKLNSVVEDGEYNLFPKVIGSSKEIKRIKKLLKKAAGTNATVLLLGDSGTGKSFIAREIHDNSERRDKPFVHINCGAIPENLLESELFGYEGGAFTGAKSGGKEGYFMLANGGTIFLDEIGEIPLALQAKLLKVIQDRRFYSVGGQNEIQTDVRIIAATNKNLEDEVIEGRFRGDLYYRINVLPITIPALKDRIEDIDELVRDRLPLICKRLGVKEKHISPEAIQKLKSHNWKGNVRELENIIERGVIMSESDTIMSMDIETKGRVDTQSIHLKMEKPETLKTAIEQCERSTIERTLQYTKGNKKTAMELLNIGKTSFYDKLKKYDI